jgi:hypothetical protein
MSLSNFKSLSVPILQYRLLNMIKIALQTYISQDIRKSFERHNNL